MNQIELENLCIGIRSCLEKWSKDGTSDKAGWEDLKNFPNGSCGLVSECLSTILYRLTGCRPYNVIGQCNDRSHRWVEMNGINIDLTGDQFNNEEGVNIPPVFISSSPHPLSAMMTTETETAYIIDTTNALDGNDQKLKKLIDKLSVELNL